MQLNMGSAVVSTANAGVPPTNWQHSRGAPNGEWTLPHPLFGETPNRATGTVALPISDCIVQLRPDELPVSRLLVNPGPPAAT